MNDSLRLPTVFDRFFDDAAIFPPGLAPLDQAVHEHIARRSIPLGGSVGPLLLTAAHLDDAARIAEALAGSEPLRVGVVVAPDEVESVLHAIEEVRPAIKVSGLELKTSNTDLKQSLADAVALSDRFDVHVEFSIDHIRAGAVSLLTETPVRLKARMGGLIPQAFPTIPDVAAVILAAVAANTSFKLTAGLHRAVRYTDATTGFDHHGFVNIAVATAAALEGAKYADLTATLAEDSGEILAERFRSIGTGWRSTFESFGTCSIVEPVDTLTELGLT